MKKSLSKVEKMSAMFIDFPKAFETINHGLLLSRLPTYGFSKQALSFRCSYLKNRRQRVQIKNKFNSLKEVIPGVPQGFIDEPLIFNLFINFFSFVLVL